MSLVLHGLLQKARLDVVSLTYRIVPTSDGYELQEPHTGLWKWKRRAWFARKADLEAFLLTELTQDER